VLFRLLALSTRPLALQRSGLFLLLGLAPGGVYPASLVTQTAVRSYRTISPLPRPLATAIGGFFSVALSRSSRTVDVIHHRALGSPDFPPENVAILQRPLGPLREPYCGQISPTRDSFNQQFLRLLLTLPGQQTPPIGQTPPRTPPLALLTLPADDKSHRQLIGENSQEG